MGKIIYNNLYYTTCTNFRWQHVLKEDSRKEFIESCFQFLVDEGRVSIYAYCIMSNHFHILWDIHKPYTVNKVTHTILSYSAKVFIAQLDNTSLKPHFVFNSDRDVQIWERNSLSVPIMSSTFLKQKFRYIHQNPVKAGLVDFASVYEWSSAKSYRDLILYKGFLSFIGG